MTPAPGSSSTQAAAVRGKAPMGFPSLHAAERRGKLTHGRTHFTDCPACRGLPALPLALGQTHPNALPFSVLQPFCPFPSPVAIPISMHICIPVPVPIPVSVPVPRLSASPPTRIPRHPGVHPDLPPAVGAASHQARSTGRCEARRAFKI